MEGPSTRAAPLLARILNGIQAGVLGGLAMFALLVANAWWNGRVWWEVPNLLGSTFYGWRAFSTGAGRATVAGVALQILLTGAAGAAFGLLCGNIESRLRLRLLGILTGIGWYYLANLVLWNWINPLVPHYLPEPVTLISHVMLGICLGSMVRTSRHAPPSTSGTDSAPERPEILDAGPSPGLLEPSRTDPSCSVNEVE